MQRRSLGCLTPAGLAGMVVTLIVVAAFGVLRGGVLFSPGALGTDCGSCHSTSAWSTAKFNLSHPEPRVDEHGTGIRHGDTTCRTCHPATVRQYTCLACHSDNQGGEGGDD